MNTNTLNSNTLNSNTLNSNTLNPTTLISTTQRSTLTDLRYRLLHLHQVLLNMERYTYEQVRGRLSSGEMLQLVIHHEQFAWLHQISELIVRIDDLLHADEPATSEEVTTLVDAVRSRLVPTGTDAFAWKYHTALQREPEAILAHASVMQVLNA